MSLGFPLRISTHEIVWVGSILKDHLVQGPLPWLSALSAAPLNSQDFQFLNSQSSGYFLYSVVV